MDTLTKRLGSILDTLQDMVGRPAAYTASERAARLSDARKVLREYHDKRAEERAVVMGVCPACGEEITRGEYEDGDVGDFVWTCPRDLSPSNRFWMPSFVTDAQQETDGVYSLCYEDHGGYCDDHMPLHGACYDRGDY